MRRLVLSAIIACTLFQHSFAKDPQSVSLPRVDVKGLDESSISLATLKGEAGTLLLFVSTDCPISNGYIPTINKLAQEYGPKGISLVLLNPNESQSRAVVSEHRDEYQVQPPVYIDEGAKVARLVGASHCPEACLFAADGRLVYKGRIDDRYFVRGKGARPVRSEDLKVALEAMLRGEASAVAYAPPVGCPIPGATTPLAVDHGAAVTYSSQISRILQKHCQECHRPDGVGPFALLTYTQAVSWAEDIERYVADGTMPPWKPADGYGEFHNRRGLSDEEKSQISAWVIAGCPQGDPALAPPPVSFPESWEQGTPDLILEMQEEFEIEADGEDVYRNFVFKTDFDSDQYVVGYEVLPSNRRVVHHVLLFVDTSGRAEAMDARDSAPGYSTDGAVGLPGFVPKGMIGGWAPGNSPHRLREGMARILPKGATVIMQVHYHKTGKVERDRTQVGLYLTPNPPKRAVGVMPLEPVSARIGTFLIPKNASDHVITCTANLPRGLTVVSVTPHMHLLGTSMKVTASLPDGSVVPLVYIPKWDFNWQETYYFREPVDLPPGAQLTLEAHYDNSPQTRTTPTGHHGP